MTASWTEFIFHKDMSVKENTCQLHHKLESYSLILLHIPNCNPSKSHTEKSFCIIFNGLPKNFQIQDHFKSTKLYYNESQEHKDKDKYCQRLLAVHLYLPASFKILLWISRCSNHVHLYDEAANWNAWESEYQESD